MLLSQAWHIDGAITPQQAMLAHTRGAAFACGLEQEVGSLRYSTSAFGVFQVMCSCQVSLTILHCAGFIIV